MKGLVSGSIFLVAIGLMAFGCSGAEPDDGPFSHCITYEADGLMRMECPLSSPPPKHPIRRASKYFPFKMYHAKLSACPESQCYMEWCWSLCETTFDLCIYNGSPRSHTDALNVTEKTSPEMHLTD